MTAPAFPPAPALPRFLLQAEAQTGALARLIAPLVGPGFVLHLKGALGGGKTALVRALLAELGSRAGETAEEAVPSPSFTLVQEYRRGELRILHADLWRVERAEETAELGLIEAAAEGAALFVEWPENGEGFLPPADLALALSFPPSPEEPGESGGRKGAQSAEGAEGADSGVRRLIVSGPQGAGLAEALARASFTALPPEAEGADAAVRSSARSPSAP